MRVRLRVGADAHARPRGRAREGLRTLGKRGKVGGRGSERVNEEKNYKILVSPNFKYVEVLNL
jgi:hypothetical protein